jgi:hypothetical protein
MVALEDVETQKRGIVLVLFDYHDDEHNDSREQLTEFLLEFMRGVPWKFMGVHYCCSEESMPFFLPFQNMIQYLIGKDGRKHFRAQRGKNTVYALQFWVFAIHDSSASNHLLLYYLNHPVRPYRLDCGN